MTEPRKTIYLDHHATTPVDPEVVEAMLPYFTTHFGNPSGTDTPAGRHAAAAVSNARAQVAALLNADPAEIVFTSGATEANNLAILGTLNALRKRTSRRRIVTTKLEHKAVLATCEAAQEHGFEITYLPNSSTGRVDLVQACDLIDQDVALVTIQAAKNEIGTIQPVHDLAELAHEAGAVFHVDAAQAVGKIELDSRALHVDLLSISAHKFYGPKGTGALYIRNGPRSFPICPNIHGGGQEHGIRSGTINVPGVVGLGHAAQLAAERLPEDAKRLASMRNVFEDTLLSLRPGICRNGDMDHRLPNNSNLTFPGIDAGALIAQVPELELSTGSACSAGAIEPSYVLGEIGLSRAEGFSTLRVGFGRNNTHEEALRAANLLSEAADRLEAMH